jgi:glycosyltransferase involved in cell wall biosynthesis
MQLLACDAVGGTEAMVTAQVLGRHAERVSYEVAILAPAGPVAARLTAGGVRVHSLAAASWPGKARQLMRVLEHGQFDIVNAYGFKATMLARLVLRRSRAHGQRPALICGVRGLHTTEVEDMGSAKARIAALLERWTRGAVDLWDANSPGAAEFIRGLGVPPDRVRCIPNGLDLRQWPSVGGGSPSGPPRILCVSRFVARKRQVDLVSALAELRDAGTVFEADLVGDGPTRDDVEGLTRSLGLEHLVRFHGTLGSDGIRNLMQRASVFCLVSTWEGMPGAVMEAMAAGLPVVGTDVNGTDMLVIDGVTGRLVPPRAPQQLAAALAEGLADPARTLEMGRAGRRRIEEEFSLEKMIDRKERLYAEVLELVR